MAIEKMKSVRINGPSSKLNHLIELCCDGGYFHCENANNFISGSMGYSSLSEESPFAATIQSIKEQSLAFGFDLETDKEIPKTSINDKVKQYIEDVGAKLSKLYDEQKLIDEQLAQCMAAIEKYSHFKGLNISLEKIFSCEYISIRFGHLPKDGYIKLMKGYNDDPYLLFCPCSKDDSGYWGAYFEPRERSGDIDKIFAALHFERLYIPGAVGTTGEIIDNLNENIKIIEQQKEELGEKIKKILDVEGEKIRMLYKKLEYLESVFELRKYAVHHGESCFFVGWIPASKEKAFTKKMQSHSEFIVGIEDPEDDSEIIPPTKIKSSFLAKPFEFFINLYGLPSYKDIDVTGFVAITYTLFFGIMFGDVGQGAVLIIAGLIAYKFMKMDIGRILIPCGMSAMCFGLVFGSFFGFEEFLDPLYEIVGLGEKPIEVMDSINLVLLIAIGIGISLVILSMCFNVLTCLKRKKIGKAIFSENGLAGIVTYIGGANFAYGFMAGEPIFPNSIGISMAIAGVIMMYNKELLVELVDEKKLYRPESISDYIMVNFFECIEYLLSYFSNTLSYLRIGAYVIVHASMMMAVFTLAGDTSTVGGMIVVVLGNIFVICLEGLLTGIQGLRLEFYEMFSRFYEGEGKAFEPAQLKQGNKNNK
ncbi:MAG: V-type ATPase 116kDa subunit family protein [Clostridia bacterium]